MTVNAADVYSAKLTTAERAMTSIATGETVSCGMAIGQPPALLAATADRLRTGDLGKIRLYYKIAKEPLASSLLAEDVIEKVNAHSFFMGAPDHVTIRRQVASGRKQVSFVPVHFRSGRRNSDRVFARAPPGCARQIHPLGCPYIGRGR